MADNFSFQIARGGQGDGVDGSPNSVAQKMNRRRGPLKAEKSTKGHSHPPI